MFLKILLVVIILLSMLFLGFSFKLVQKKNSNLPTASNKLSTDITDNIDEPEIMTNIKQEAK